MLLNKEGTIVCSTHRCITLSRISPANRYVASGNMEKAARRGCEFWAPIGRPSRFWRIQRVVKTTADEPRSNAKHRAWRPNTRARQEKSVPGRVRVHGQNRVLGFTISVTGYFVNPVLDLDL